MTLEDKKLISELVKRWSFEDVLVEIADEAKAVGNISGQELSSKLGSLIGNFGYFPVRE